MWPAIFDFSVTTLSVMCCAAAVKLADDFLDYDIDTRMGRYNWAEILGKGTMFYSLILVIIAAGLNATVSMPLFLGSYIIGMFNDLKQRFPSRLSGFQESLVVFVIGFILFGFRNMIFALLFIFAVQLLDDCIDAYSDKLAGYRNLAHRLGLIESLLLAGLCTIGSWWISETLFPPVLCGTILFYGGLFYKEARL